MVKKCWEDARTFVVQKVKLSNFGSGRFWRKERDKEKSSGSLNELIVFLSVSYKLFSISIFCFYRKTTLYMMKFVVNTVFPLISSEFDKVFMVLVQWKLQVLKQGVC